MRWLVVGAAGMLGTDMVSLLEDRDEDVTRLVRGDVDLDDSAAVEAAVSGHDVVVNCAGWTAVDDAEDHEEEAWLLNATLPARLAQACLGAAALLVQISTDYVFNGSGSTPYAEDAATAPSSVYGRSKEAGERAVQELLPDRHLVVRTAWLYGEHGSCFPKTMARVLRQHGAAKVVDDQIGQPTWTVDVADAVLRLVKAGKTGTFHATSSGQCSWFELTRQVAESIGADPAVVAPVPTSEFPRPAPRPAYSVLGHDAWAKAGLDAIGDWRDRWAAAAASIVG